MGDTMDSEIEKIRNDIRSKKEKKHTSVKYKNNNNNNKNITLYVTKFLFTIIFTLVALILLKKNSSFKDSFYRHVYEENISFASINNLYKKYFGNTIPFSDLFLKRDTTVFNETLTYNSKEAYLDGVKLNVNNNYLVPVLESGMVVFIGDKGEYGNTIIVQQMNGVDVWYSNIESNVKLYDYIEKGEVLGECKSNFLYLTFKRDGKVQNYEDYI